MSSVVVTNVEVLNNPTLFMSPFEFEVTFECLSPLTDDLEWNLTYLGNSGSEKYEKLLDSVLLGPVSVGLNRFIFNADPPDVYQMSRVDGVVAVLLTCSYRDQEFIRVGYFVNNEYTGPEEPEVIEGKKKVLIELPAKEEEEEDDEDEEEEEEDEENEEDELDMIETEKVSNNVEMTGNSSEKNGKVNGNGNNSNENGLNEDQKAENFSEEPTYVKPPLPKTHKTPQIRYISVYPEYIQRNVLSQNPRVTLFNIDWGDTSTS